MTDNDTSGFPGLDAGKKAIGAKLDHPIFGAIAVSWILWNWPGAILIPGAVAHPAFVADAFATYIQKASLVRTIWGPLASGIIVSLLITPVADIVWAWVFFRRERKKDDVRRKSEGMILVDRNLYETTLDEKNMLDKKLKELNTKYSEIENESMLMSQRVANLKQLTTVIKTRTSAIVEILEHNSNLINRSTYDPVVKQIFADIKNKISDIYKITENSSTI